MVKSNPPKAPANQRPQAKTAPSSARSRVYVDEGNLAEVEKETIDKVNRTLTTLESAIATWEQSPKKPPELKPKFDKYVKLHDALTEWERKMLISISKGEEFQERVQKLQEFVDICYAYA